MKVTANSSIKTILKIVLVLILVLIHLITILIFTSRSYQSKNTKKRNNFVNRAFLNDMKKFRNELYPENRLNGTLIEILSLLPKDKKKVEGEKPYILPFCNDIGLTFDSSSFDPLPLKIGKSLSTGTNRIFKVHQSQTDKQFILKVFGSKKDFKKEKELYDSMHNAGNHENIAKAFCILKAENSPVVLNNGRREGILLQFVSSWDISSIGWTQREETSIEDIRIASIKIFKAMKWIHNLGWIHSDLHGCNILIDKENNPIIIDFGNSDKINNHNIQKRDSWMGVMSPESSNLIKYSKFSVTEAMDVWTFANTIAGWFANKYLPDYKNYNIIDSTYSYRGAFSLVNIHAIYGFKINRTPIEFPLYLREFLFLLINPDPNLRSFDNKAIRRIVEDLPFFKNSLNLKYLH